MQPYYTLLTLKAKNLYSNEAIMESDLAQEAIACSLSCDWEKAILTNSKILHQNPKDVDALNRIARAYAENKDIKKAMASSQKALKIDPNNPIAMRCLEKWNNYRSTPKASPALLIEESGKTKTINLIKLGNKSVLLALNCGDIVKITPNTHRVNVTTTEGKYIGRFPDDLAIKFIKLIKLGNSYQALIKSVSENNIKIFVRPL